MRSYEIIAFFYKLTLINISSNNWRNEENIKKEHIMFVKLQKIFFKHISTTNSKNMILRFYLKYSYVSHLYDTNMEI